MKAMRKRLVLWSIGILVVLVIGLAFRPKPLAADFAVVEYGSLRVTIDEEGETRVRDRFVVSAPLAGRVLRIELEPGDVVRAGETVLATFQPSDPILLDARTRAEAEARVGAAEAALGLARAERDRAEAELRFARSDVKRYRSLAAEEIVSRERAETAELAAQTREEALEAAEFAVRSAEQELAAARASLLETTMEETGRNDSGRVITLRSPVDGLVLRRLRESEAVVPAGEALLEIADPAELEIVSDLLSTDAVRIRRGNPVLIEQWGGERPLRGVVRRVEPSGFTKISALGVEEQRVNVVIDFEDPREAWEALGDGYRVEVRVVVWERDEVLKVPTSSLFRDGDGWAVFAVEEGRAVLRPLEIGQRNALEAEVLSGLGEGDQVIVHPSDSVADGVAVMARS